MPEVRGDDSLTMAKHIKCRLYRKYLEEVIPFLHENTGIKNTHGLPEIEKVVVNMGLKKAKDDTAVLDEAVGHLAAITGQKPVITKSKKAISNFGLKKGTPIGCMVTLRGVMMYEFLERVLRIVLPRIRDFSGIKRSFDRFGNLTIGIRDESIFPEINPDSVKNIKGLGITIVTSGKDRDTAERMFERLEFPFVR